MHRPRYTVLILIAAGIAALLVSACRSGGDPPLEVSAEVDISLDRIDRLLAEGKNLRALPLILARMKTDDEEGRYDIAVDGMASAWAASREDRDWRQSLVYHRSFAVLGEEGPWNDITEAELFLEGALDYIERDRPGAAAALLQSEQRPRRSQRRPMACPAWHP